jgi:hypothetical protein
MNPRANRAKTLQIMFETFNAGAAYIVPTSILALYASGRTSGLVIDSGHDITSAVPIFEGHVLSYGIQQTKTGGRHLSDYLRNLLNERSTPSLPSIASLSLPSSLLTTPTTTTTTVIGTSSSSSAGGKDNNGSNNGSHGGRIFSTTVADRELIRDIKEKICYITSNYEEEIKLSHQTKQYELPGKLR